MKDLDCRRESCMDRVSDISSSSNSRLHRSNLTRIRSKDGRSAHQTPVQIAEFPHSGRKVPEYESDEVREVLEWPYRIIYLIEVASSRVDLLAVIHGSRNQTDPLRRLILEVG